MIAIKTAHTTLCFLIETHASWGADWGWGCPLILLTVIIHVLSLGSISQRVVLIYGDIMKSRYPIPAFTLVVGATTLFATILHAIETAIWAAAYLLLGALPDLKSAMLYSLGAMTTYGHQGLFLEHQWQLLGTIEALNGWLLFGLSTAFLFWMIQEVSPKSRAGH
jgi:hypothetical protein